MRGLEIFSPSEVTARSLMPRSTPTTAPVAGSCTGSATSTAKETYQRPHGSRETVTVVGSIDAASTSGQDQVNASEEHHQTTTATAEAIEADFGDRWGAWLSDTGRWWAARADPLTSA